MLRLVCTGISCSGAGEYLSKVSELHEIELFDVGHMIFEIAKNLRKPIDEPKVLDKDDHELDPFRAAVFEKIIGEANKHKNLIVRTHACFTWKKRLRKAFDPSYLQELSPTHYVTITDSFSIIMERMNRSQQWKGKLTLEEVLKWREEETFLTRLIADYQQKKSYFITTKQPPETFPAIFDEEVKKLYLSYPISHMEKKIEEWISEKNENLDRLREYSIVFDPLDISDASHLSLARRMERKNKRTFKALDAKLKFETKDVIKAEDYISSQTVAKDEALIDQSDGIVVLYPEAVRSHGVAHEIEYGISLGRDVFIVTPLERDPFTDYEIPKRNRFPSVEKLLAYLQKAKFFKKLPRDVKLA
jgi:adenylate kinase